MAYNGIHLNQYEGFVDCGEIKGQYGIGAMQVHNTMIWRKSLLLLVENVELRYTLRD